MKKWYVYILECQDGSFYTGVTNDVDARMKAHAEGKGSKYVYRKGFKEFCSAWRRTETSCLKKVKPFC